MPSLDCTDSSLSEHSDFTSGQNAGGAEDGRGISTLTSAAEAAAAHDPWPAAPEHNNIDRKQTNKQTKKSGAKKWNYQAFTLALESK